MTVSSNDIAKSHEKLNYYIFTNAVPMATNLGRTVTYLEGLQTIKSYNALNMWSCMVM